MIMQKSDAEKKSTIRRIFSVYYFRLRRLIIIFTANIAEYEFVYLPKI